MEKSRRRNVKNTYSWLQMLDIYGNYCAYCQVEAAQTIDHVIPWSYSFCDEIWNLRPCCLWCNLHAGSQVFDSFESKQDFLRKRRFALGENFKRRTICTTCFLPYQRPIMTTSMFECPICDDNEHTFAQKKAWKDFCNTMQLAGIDLEIHKLIREIRQSGASMDRARNEMGELYLEKILRGDSDDYTLEDELTKVRATYNINRYTNPNF